MFSGMTVRMDGINILYNNRSSVLLLYISCMPICVFMLSLLKRPIIFTNFNLSFISNRRHTINNKIFVLLVGDFIDRERTKSMISVQRRIYRFPVAKLRTLLLLL